MSIVEFRDCVGNLLDPQVEGDVLSGIRQADAMPEREGSKLECPKSEGSKSKGSTLKDLELVGAVLTLGVPGVRGKPASRDYELKIRNFAKTPFWAGCQGQDKKCSEEFPIYDFDAKRIGDSCSVQVCAPGLDNEKHPGSISGTAVIFRGEIYDKQHRVTIPQGNDDDVFNIACMGTALSKLHLLRHTTASQPVVSGIQKTPPQTITPQTTTPQTTTLQKRAQAMLRLLTADYCGNGSAFTMDGLPIKLGFDNAELQLLESSGYLYGNTIGIDATGTIDALWTDAGATCVGTPRHTRKTLEQIQGICSAANLKFLKLPGAVGLQIDPVPQDCAKFAPPVSFAKGPYALGSYAISGNPPKPIVPVQ